MSRQVKSEFAITPFILTLVKEKLLDEVFAKEMMRTEKYSLLHTVITKLLNNLTRERKKSRKLLKIIEDTRNYHSHLAHTDSNTHISVEGKRLLAEMNNTLNN